MYHVESDDWEALGSMKVPRYGTSVIALGGKAYIPGDGDAIGVAPVSYSDVFLPGL
jgi:hypothetical protein